MIKCTINIPEIKTAKQFSNESKVAYRQGFHYNIIKNSNSFFLIVDRKSLSEQAPASGLLKDNTSVRYPKGLAPFIINTFYDIPSDDGEILPNILLPL